MNILRLYSKRRLIKTDLEQLLKLTELTRKRCGYMSQGEVKDFLANGRVHGVFSAEKLCAVEFCGRQGRGLCIDRMLMDMVREEVTVSYIRVAEEETECVSYLLGPKQLSPTPHCILIHYNHIETLAEMLSRNFQLTALRGGLGNKPYLLIECGAKSEPNDDYRFCVSSDSKSLSRMLEHGYRAVGAMGNKLILTMTA